jgi:predicted Zn-dependent protease
LGIQTMAAAGYDPEGMASFFAKLEVQSRLYGAGLPEILRTHPVNTSRIAEARARAARMPAHRGRDSSEYGMVRARTEVLMSSRPNEALESFAAKRKAGDQSHAVNYGYALSLYRSGLAADAEAVLSPVINALPKQVNVNLLQARILLARERPNEAVALLQKQMAQNPKSAPVLFSYAQTLLDVGKPDEARNLLLESEPAYANDSERHRLLADAARQQGNIPETQFQMASLAEARGNLREAIGQLQAALRLSEMPEKDRIRLQAYRDEIVARVPRSQLQELDRQRRPLQALHSGHGH